MAQNVSKYTHAGPWTRHFWAKIGQNSIIEQNPYHIGQPWAPRRPIKAYDGPRQRSFLTRDYLPGSSSWFGREGTGGHYMRTQPRLLHAGP